MALTLLFDARLHLKPEFYHAWAPDISRVDFFGPRGLWMASRTNLPFFDDGDYILGP